MLKMKGDNLILVQLKKRDYSNQTYNNQLRTITNNNRSIKVLNIPQTLKVHQ